MKKKHTRFVPCKLLCLFLSFWLNMNAQKYFVIGGVFFKIVFMNEGLWVYIKK